MDRLGYALCGTNGMRKYGGLTKSQAKMFVDKNSLTKVEELEQKLTQGALLRMVNIQCRHLKLKEGLFGNRGAKV